MRSFQFLEKQCCPACRRVRNFGEFCGEKCRKGSFLDMLIVCMKYDKSGLLKKLIVQFKYRFSEELCVVLGEILKTQFVYNSQFLPEFKDAVIVPVPLHEKRLKYRGFNQAKLLALYLLQSLRNDETLGGYFRDLKVCEALNRVLYTEAQAHLGRAERLHNLENSFVFNEEFGEIIRNKFIILVDDVATTGTTLNECAKTLKMAGARRICGLVLARGD